MATEEEIEEFLRHLRIKMSVFDIAFRHRPKNLDSLAVLEISALDRKEFIKNLKLEDCFSGPNKDQIDSNQPDYFEFGLQINGNEVYIKLSLGLPNKMIDCISFHVAEFPIIYPFKMN